MENTGSVVFVTTAHDQRSHHCHLESFAKMSKYQARLLVINNRIYTAISKKVVGKTVHATIPKGNMGYDQYTVSDTVAVEPTFAASF